MIRRAVRTRTTGPAGLATAALLLALAGAGGCNTPGTVAPAAPLRAVSAALYAIDVEFPVPLDRATAEDIARYAVYPTGSPTARATIASATLIDTVSLRVVQLTLPDWVTDSTFDRAGIDVETHGVKDWWGVSTGDRLVSFRTGLAYSDSLGPFFDARCNSCHGAANPSGGYRTDSYAALLGPGTSPTPNLIPGDPRCLLVIKCKPGNSMYLRSGMGFFEYERLVNWIVIYQARP